MNLSYLLVVFFARWTGTFLDVTFFFAGSFFWRISTTSQKIAAYS